MYAIRSYYDAAIKVRVSKEMGEKRVTRLIDATVGRLIFNENIPQDLGFVDRTNSEKQFELEVSAPLQSYNFV